MKEDNDLKCNFCHEQFDIFNRQPRLMPQCKHNICEKCLIDRMHSNSDIICPVDKKTVKFSDFDFDQFQEDINLVIQLTKKIDETLQHDISTNLIPHTPPSYKHQDEKRNNKYQYEDTSVLTDKKQVGMSKDKSKLLDLDNSDDSDYYSTENTQFCQEHRRKMELICIDCGIRCCYKCAVFDRHKGHSLKENQEFYDEVDEYKRKITSYLKKLDKKENYLKTSLIEYSFNEKMEKKLKFIKKKQINNFDKAIIYLQKLKDESLQKLNDQTKQRESQLRQKALQEIESSKNAHPNLKNNLKNLLKALNDKEEAAIIQIMRTKQNEDYIKQIKLIVNNIKSKTEQLEEQLENFFNKIDSDFNFKFEPRIECFQIPSFDFFPMQDNQDESMIQRNSRDQRFGQEKTRGKGSKSFVRKTKTLIGSSNNNQKNEEMLLDMKVKDFQDADIDNLDQQAENEYTPNPKLNLSVNVSSIGNRFNNFNSMNRNGDTPTRDKSNIQRKSTMHDQLSQSTYGGRSQSNSRFMLHASKTMKSFSRTGDLPQNSPNKSFQAQPLKKSFTQANLNTTQRDIQPETQDVGGSSSIQALINDFKKSNSSALKLKGIGLKDQHMKLFQNLFRFDKKIRILDLSQNMLSNVGLKEICSDLENSQVVEIDLSGNSNLTYKSLYSLLNLAKQNKNLQKIYYRGNVVNNKNKKIAVDIFTKEKVAIIFY